MGLSLRANRHDVLFPVETNFEQRVRLLGFPIRVLTGNQAEALGPYNHQIFNSDQALAAQPTSMPLPVPLQRLANRFSWWIGGLVLRQMVDKPINRIRRTWRVQPRSNLMWTGNLSPTFTALAVSPALVSRPDDWPGYIHMTGFCFWDGSEDWQPSEALLAFLQIDC